MRATPRSLVGVAVLGLLLTPTLFAHEVIVRGTVAAIEKTRIQIKTGEEKKDQAPAWYPIDAATRIKRGETIVTFEQARIKVDERVVAIIDHPDKGPTKTKELRLAPAGGAH
jgi:hypothetical protein